MANLSRRTVTLGKSQSDYIDSKIASGRYASASEVVRAGLAALNERDAMVERWLKTDVAATFDHSVTNPDEALDLDAAFAAIRGQQPKHSAG
jgi:antitoxin ParD1/3/4